MLSCVIVSKGIILQVLRSYFELVGGGGGGD